MGQVLNSLLISQRKLSQQRAGLHLVKGSLRNFKSVFPQHLAYAFRGGSVLGLRCSSFFSIRSTKVGTSAGLMR